MTGGRDVGVSMNYNYCSSKRARQRGLVFFPPPPLPPFSATGWRGRAVRCGPGALSFHHTLPKPIHKHVHQPAIDIDPHPSHPISHSDARSSEHKAFVKHADPGRLRRTVFSSSCDMLFCHCLTFHFSVPCRVNPFYGGRRQILERLLPVFGLGRGAICLLFLLLIPPPSPVGDVMGARIELSLSMEIGL